GRERLKKYTVAPTPAVATAAAPTRPKSTRRRESKERRSGGAGGNGVRPVGKGRAVRLSKALFSDSGGAGGCGPVRPGAMPGGPLIMVLPPSPGCLKKLGKCPDGSRPLVGQDDSGLLWLDGCDPSGPLGQGAGGVRELSGCPVTRRSSDGPRRSLAGGNDSWL